MRMIRTLCLAASLAALAGAGSNRSYSGVDTAFEGEALATVFDSQIFPLDSTSAPEDKADIVAYLKRLE